MKSIEELLPLCEGLKDDFFIRQTRTLQPGRFEEWVASDPGWMASVLVVANNPFTEISHDIWVRPTAYTFYQMQFITGFTRVNDAFNYITVYDTVNNIYALVYHPKPYKAFEKDNYLRVTAPNTNPLTGLPITTPTTLTAFTIQYIYLFDKEAFETSLRELLGTTKIT